MLGFVSEGPSTQLQACKTSRVNIMFNYFECKGTAFYFLTVGFRYFLLLSVAIVCNNVLSATLINKKPDSHFWKSGAKLVLFYKTGNKSE